VTASDGLVVNWNDVPSRAVEFGPIAGHWSNLGEAAGTVDTGLRRIQIAPGKRSTPVHTHAAEEEVFFVLAGTGLSYQGESTYEVRQGDCLVHLPKAAAHTLIAGDDGLDVLAFGERRPPESAFLPRAGVSWLGPTWVTAGEGPHPFAREAAVGELELGTLQPRPATIVNLDDVELKAEGKGRFEHQSRDLGRAAGSRRVGLRYVRLEAGVQSWPLHCHTCEEEIFVVLEGEGTFVLGDDEHPLRRGDVVARPAGQGVAHAVQGGDGGLTYLAFGERDTGDVIWYPKSKKLFVRGLRVIFRVEPVGYWDGEV
jgi:uncharacterized cupin superfamily protein